MQKDRNRVQFLSFPFSANIASYTDTEMNISILAIDCIERKGILYDSQVFKLHLIYKYAISENNCDRKFFSPKKRKSFETPCVCVYNYES